MCVAGTLQAPCSVPAFLTKFNMSIREHAAFE